jgi:UDP-N-acetylglucosamine 2-epimerase (non-hydrolysing)
MMKVLHVVDARSNYMETAPTMREMALHHAVFQQVLLHTGQQYDENMSDRFFAQLGMGLPDEFLEVGSGTHAEQTARVMPGFEFIVKRHRRVGELRDGCAVRASSRLCSVACHGLIG